MKKPKPDQNRPDSEQSKTPPDRKTSRRRFLGLGLKTAATALGVGLFFTAATSPIRADNCTEIGKNTCTGQGGPQPLEMHLTDHQGNSRSSGSSRKIALERWGASRL